MPNFRKGAAAIQQALDENSGGGFTPFAPNIAWKEDKEEKYVLILTPIDEIPRVQLHDFVPIGEGTKGDGSTFSKYGFYISRKDPGIGEDYDLLEDRNEFKPKDRNIAVAVELEPVMKEVGGRKRPKGFVVKTREFERRIDPEDDESDKETVTAPLIGVIIQSPYNFFGYLSSFNDRHGPHEETAFYIQRRGKTTDTEYDFEPYHDQPIDLSPLVDNVEGISYLNEQLDEIVEQVDDLEEADAAEVIATHLLDTRLEELSDSDRYKKEVEPLENLKPKFGGSKKKGKGSKRPDRKSQRRSKNEDDDAPDDTPDEDEKPARSKGRRDRFDDMKAKAAKKNQE